ncbi:MAG TPA: SDR family oxidoreductase [Chitinophagales bacterium]|nr:SDR family oxidoreductase [Chitinophagales bacterium]HMU98934.1 SDR family oxidoreductase [Chitinophagales bacterium]HMV03371.1 SDR family oxidoreductase [Chitinophagales bacterium]HMW95061.1 SDR family oxidoreductase [Chitinophagales bacterium]HMZ69337.1 SDR family oxidoreductase [Chitinophagales bacterium]
MKTFIIGASGLVGGNCLEYFNAKNWENIGTYFSFKTDDTVFFDTLNLDNPDNFDVKKFQPNVIVHCGALTHVDYCETNEQESYKKTVLSTKNIVDLAVQLNSKLVFISTDYIFDGTNGPYAETDKPNPISIYGKHKLEAENYVLDNIKEAIVLRITNVYGDEIRGKNFVSRIVEQAQNNQHLTLKLPIDQYATPINAADIARCLYLLLNDKQNGIFNIASTDYMNRVQLALRILHYFPNASYDLIPLKTTALNQPASRPLQGGLKNEKFATLYPDFVFSTVDEYVSSKIDKQ